MSAAGLLPGAAQRTMALRKILRPITLNFFALRRHQGAVGKKGLVAVLQHSWSKQSDTMTGPDCTVGNGLA
jgi:hypothetical protein